MRINLRIFTSTALLATFAALVLSPSVGQAQSESGPKVSVGILPFDDASEAGISDNNVAVLARQLRAQLTRSGKLTARTLTLAPGTALPLEAEQVSRLGLEARVDFACAPTVTQAESKPFQKGASLGRSVFGIQLGGARATGVVAEVKLHVDLIRASDGQRVDTFTVESKKTTTSMSTEAAGVATNLGTADAGAANFQNSPLGQALEEAMTKLVAQLEARSEKIARQAGAASPQQKTTAPIQNSLGVAQATGSQEGSASAPLVGGTPDASAAANRDASGTEGPASNAVPHPNNTKDWGMAIAKQLAGLVPQPIPGLINHLPWHRPNELRLYDESGCGLGDPECGLFPEPQATIGWDFDDPDLVKQVEAVTREEDALVALAKDPKADVSRLGPLGKKADELRRRSRTLGLSLTANASIQGVRDEGMKAAGTLKDYPLYRYSYPTADTPDDNVRLAVFVGPAGFKNPAGPRTRLEVKTVRIEVSIHSRAQAVTADGAVARQMLEKVDYDGLKKLLQP